MAAGSLDSQMDDVIGNSEIDMQLEERKRRLGLSEPPAVTFEEEESEEAAASS